MNRTQCQLNDFIAQSECKRRKLLKSSADYTDRHGTNLFTFTIESILPVTNRMSQWMTRTKTSENIKRIHGLMQTFLIAKFQMRNYPNNKG